MIGQVHCAFFYSFHYEFLWGQAASLTAKISVAHFTLFTCCISGLIKHVLCSVQLHPNTMDGSDNKLNLHRIRSSGHLLIYWLLTVFCGSRDSSWFLMCLTLTVPQRKLQTLGCDTDKIKADHPEIILMLEQTRTWKILASVTLPWVLLLTVNILVSFLQISLFLWFPTFTSVLSLFTPRAASLKYPNSTLEKLTSEVQSLQLPELPA